MCTERAGRCSHAVAVATFLLLWSFAAVQAQPAVTISEYPAASPFDITAGPDGNMWFTNYGSIGRITAGGVVNSYSIPSGNRIASRITRGGDGALWFTENTPGADSPAIGRITTAGVIREYPLPASASGIRGIAYGPDGALWFTNWSGGKIGRMTTDGALTEYALPGAVSTDWITVGPDGALWFTEAGDRKVGRITTAGFVTEFAVPAAATGSQASVLAGIAPGPDGALWVTEWVGHRILRVTTSGVVTQYDVPACLTTATNWICADGITAGPDGALWFTLFSANSIGRISTAGVITTFPIPTGNSQSSGIAAGPDGSVWFTEHAGRKIGRAVVQAGDTTPPLLVPQIAGMPGINGWYRSAVTVRWDVSDPESGIRSASGCDAVTLGSDTAGVTLACSATNGAGLSNTRSVTVRIDKTPPVITGMPVAGCVLWPPDHKLRLVAIVRAADALSGTVASSLGVQVTSNAPAVGGPGEPDVVIAKDASGAYTVLLRAERAGHGDGRVYRVSATAFDLAGNTRVVTAVCVVPHDR